MLLWIFRIFFAIAMLGMATAVATSPNIPDRPHLFIQLSLIVLVAVGVVVLDLSFKKKQITSMAWNKESVVL